MCVTNIFFVRKICELFFFFSNYIIIYYIYYLFTSYVILFVTTTTRFKSMYQRFFFNILMCVLQCCHRAPDTKRQVIRAGNWLRLAIVAAGFASEWGVLLTAEKSLYVILAGVSRGQQCLIRHKTLDEFGLIFFTKSWHIHVGCKLVV